jgi:hypothetical protein
MSLTPALKSGSERSAWQLAWAAADHALPVFASLRPASQGTFTLKNALKNGHFSPFSVGPLLQWPKLTASGPLLYARVKVHWLRGSAPKAKH